MLVRQCCAVIAVLCSECGAVVRSDTQTQQVRRYIYTQMRALTHTCRLKLRLCLARSTNRAMHETVGIAARKQHVLWDHTHCLAFTLPTIVPNHFSKAFFEIISRKGYSKHSSKSFLETISRNHSSKTFLEIYFSKLMFEAYLDPILTKKIKENTFC